MKVVKNIFLYSLPGLIFGIAINWIKLGPPPAPSVDVRDLDGNGRPDVTIYYRNGLTDKVTYDRNQDGIEDYEEFYLEGVIQNAYEDRNFDGSPDVWYFFNKGQIQKSLADNDFNGVEDVEYSFSYGILRRAEWRPNNGIVRRIENFIDGVKVESFADEDGDGRFEILRIFDPFENVKHVEQLGIERK